MFCIDGSEIIVVRKLRHTNGVLHAVRRIHFQILSGHQVRRITFFPGNSPASVDPEADIKYRIVGPPDPHIWGLGKGVEDLLRTDGRRSRNGSISHASLVIAD